MRKKQEPWRRSGAYAVEAAIVIPVMIFLLLGLLLGGMGVFHYQQVACQAREAARYACVRGADFRRDTKQASPTQEAIFEQAVLPFAASMDTTQLTLSVEWIDEGSGAAYAWDSASKTIKSITPLGEYVTNMVRVTVTYVWSPGMFISPVTITSVSELPMSF